MKSPATEIVYLASPYTHPDNNVREERFRRATLAAAHLISKGNIVYSPITMTHPIDVVLAGKNQTLGSDYWVAFDEAFMQFCNKIVILQLPGWEQSSGIAREIRYFRNHRKPIQYLNPSEIDV